MTRFSKHTARKKAAQRSPLRVVELFAGVGGFRLGLSQNGSCHDFETVWFNQWEPTTKRQHAHDVYVARFPAKKNEVREYTNTDIAEVVQAALCGDFTVPDHDVLVGGFPCQDYSVARTLGQAAGIAGKKGVLWWEIRSILELKQKEGKPVPYIFLENVDRLLKSPATQRGRDFAIMLTTLADLGYAVEWRVVNAADYGMPQRRRRVFIVGYHMSSPLYENMEKTDPHHVLLKKGVLASAFPVFPKSAAVDVGSLMGNCADITERFNAENPKVSPFHTSGVMRVRQFHTVPTTAAYTGPHATLGDVLLNEEDVSKEYFVSGDVEKWKYLKGAKNEPRTGVNGFTFTYTEGPMVFPDSLDRPSRTIVTGEGGTAPSRFKHVVQTPSGRCRRLTPIELERLCMFPDNHTALPGVSDVRRAFFMGNALVVGVIEQIGTTLAHLHKQALEQTAASRDDGVPSLLTSRAASKKDKRAPTTPF